MYSKYSSKIYGLISAAVLGMILVINIVSSKPSEAYTSQFASPESQASQLVAQAEQFTLPPLPYEYGALEAFIDRATMTIHHDKHHAGYVKNLNEAIALYPQLVGQSVEELLVNLESLPADVRTTIRNNGGGHANHTMFWSIMTPDSPGEPTGAIATEINSAFGDFASFQTEFNTAGKTQFGSGWAWLVMNADGALEVMSTANQDSPLLEGKYPIMGNDVWEHAYYLKYQNKRADYLDAWWNVVNWDEVNNRLQAAQEFFNS